MATDRLFRKIEKKFLTDDANEFGTICYEVSASRYKDGAPYEMNATLRLQDCYETINFDFYIGKKKTKFEERINKLQNLIDTLEEMKSVMESGYEMVETHNKLNGPFEDDTNVSASFIINES